MTLVKSIKICYFEKYANFCGRASRWDFWLFALVNSILIFLLDLFTYYAPMAILYSLFSLALTIPGIAVTIRRMHDTGHSGWYLLIPIYNLILALTPSDNGENEYGELDD